MTMPDNVVKPPRDRLFRTVQLLAGENRGFSRTELQLRLFQFRYWLLSTYSTPDAFRVGGILFAQLKLEQQIREYRRKWPTLSGGKLMLLSCGMASMQQVLDDAVRSDTSLDALINSKIDPLGNQEPYRSEIKQLNNLIKVRVRLGKSVPEGQDQNMFASLNKSLKFLYNKPAKGIVSRSTMSQIHRERHDRESFLLACELCKNEEFDILEFGESSASVDDARNKVLQKLDTDLLILGKDKSFLAKSKFILKILNNTLYDRLEGAWQNLEPDQVLELTPIPPSADSDEAGHAFQ